MDKGVEVYKRDDSSIAFTGRLKGKLHLDDFTSNRVKPKTCLMEKNLALVGYGITVLPMLG
jgi:hypothetical protein